MRPWKDLRRRRPFRTVHGVGHNAARYEIDSDNVPVGAEELPALRRVGPESTPSKEPEAASGIGPGEPDPWPPKLELGDRDGGTALVPGIEVRRQKALAKHGLGSTGSGYSRGWGHISVSVCGGFKP